MQRFIVSYRYIFVCFIINVAFTNNSIAKQQFALKEVIHYALCNSIHIDNAQQERLLKDLEYKNTITKMFPTLDLTVTQKINKHPAYLPGTINNNVIDMSSMNNRVNNSINIGVLENIYDNGVSLVEKKKARYSKRIAVINNEQAQAKLMLDISSAFYRYSLLDALQKIKTQQIHMLEKELHLVQTQYKQGLKTKLDFLRFKTQTERAYLEYEEMQKEQAIAAILLQKTLGIINIVEIEFIPINSSTSNLNLPQDYLKLTDVYAYKIAQIQQKINKQAILLAQKKYYPQISIGAGMSYQHSINHNAKHYTMHPNVGLNLSYNLWDWGERKRAVSIAKVQEYIQNNEISLLLVDVAMALKDLLVQIERLHKNYPLLQELYANEEENYRTIEIQYKEGKATYLDLITGINNMLSAKIQLHQAYFAGLELTTKWHFYAGTLNEKFFN